MVFQDNYIGWGVGEAVAASQDAQVIGRGLSLQVYVPVGMSAPCSLCRASVSLCVCFCVCVFLRI